MRSLSRFFVTDICNKYAEFHSVTLWLKYGALIVIRTRLELRAYFSDPSQRKVSNIRVLLMKLARIKLKLVHQISKNLSLIVTREYEVNVYENSNGLQAQIRRTASFTSLIYTLLVAKEVGIRKLCTASVYLTMTYS